MYTGTNSDGSVHDESARQGVLDANSSPRESAVPGPGPEEITRELKLILASPPFRPSKRSQEFLSFVVQYRLEGIPEPLKERTLGTEIFHRPAGYDTGYDSVVRVLAGEVRRRLHLYAHARPSSSRVQIDLPVGSYTPLFSWFPQPPDPVAAREFAAGQMDTVDTVVEAASATGAITHPIATAPAHSKSRVWLISWGAALAIACLFLVPFLRGRSEIDRFWAPLFAGKRPVLIYVPKLLCFRPTNETYKRTAISPGEFDAEVDRLNLPPHLKPTDTIQWSDMYLDIDQGLGKGDVKAAIRLSRFLLEKHIENDVRIGNEFSFEDMRTSPTVIIGAFSNRWTMQMTSGLHFAFVEENGVPLIKENGDRGQTWHTEYDRNQGVAVDYGIVTRLANPKTGQYSIFVAGITASGSDAAADLVTNPEAMKNAVANLPADWMKRNIQVLVKTSVTDSITSPPAVVATFVW
jgi:hypothetical protein